MNCQMHLCESEAAITLEDKQLCLEHASEIQAYNAKLTARYERRYSRALQMEKEAIATLRHNEKLSPPAGQPILIGHHSEKRHRRLLARLWASDGQAFKKLEQAKSLKEQTPSTAILFDDPAALLKLNDKLAQLEETHDKMKRVNAAIRATKGASRDVITGLLIKEFGFSHNDAEKMATVNARMGQYRQGYQEFELTNSNAMIRNTKERIQDLERQAEKQASGLVKAEETRAGIRITRGKDEADKDRIRLNFEGKPVEEVRAKLKAFGFRWSPMNTAWQCYNTANGQASMGYFLTWYEESSFYKAPAIAEAEPVQEPPQEATPQPAALAIGGGGPVVAKVFTPSKYQEAIFDTLRNPSATANVMVKAVAGSGKTTTIVQGAKYIQAKSGIFCAFNSHIVKELNARLRGTRFIAKTIHGLGMAMVREYLGGVDVDEDKYKRLLKDYSQQHRFAEGDFVATKKLIDLARINLTTETDYMEEILLHQGISYTNIDEVAEAARTIIKLGVQDAQSSHKIDFTDMIYLPNLWELAAKGADVVMADECQDFSKAQLYIILKHVAGRAIFVGDPNQAIYGFAGADANSYANIAVQTQAMQFPLSICYRCAPNILDLARTIVPEIEADPSRQNGIIEAFPQGSLYKIVQGGDLVLSRITAPLIVECIDLIGKRIPASIKGREVGKELSAIVDEVDKKYLYQGYRDFGRVLEDYEDAQIAVLSQKSGRETQIQKLHDKCEAIRAAQLGYATEVTSTLELKSKIEALFSDDAKGVTLATIHRTKGLEAERVHIIATDKLPLTWKNQQPWQWGQEMNTFYVALTRAKHALFIENGTFGNGLSI